MEQHGHDGHRARMRNRFAENYTFDGFAEHEILEMLLFYAIPRANTNQLAHSLIEQFGSIRNVLAASPEELKSVKGLGDSGVTALKIFYQLSFYINRQGISTPSVKDFSASLEYVKTFFKDEKKEKIKVFCINNSFRFQSAKDVSTGKNDHVSLDFKELTKIILNSECNCIILAHNHPFALNTPSQEDIILTRKLMGYLRMLDITMLDHYIVGTNGIISMRNCGLIYDSEC